MKRTFGRRSIKHDLDVDITSLLDILTILLVFLLNSYNATNLELNVQKDLKPALSKSMVLTSFAPVVQITANKEIFLNDISFGNLDSQDVLKKLLLSLQEESKKLTNNLSKVDPKKINLLVDQALSYSDLKRLLGVIKSGGFSDFKLIVKGT